MPAEAAIRRWRRRHARLPSGARMAAWTNVGRRAPARRHNCRVRVVIPCLLAAVLLLNGAAGADARGLSEKALRAYETATIGPEHAAEHAEQRRAARIAERVWKRMSPRARAAYRHRLRQA